MTAMIDLEISVGEERSKRDFMIRNTLFRGKRKDTGEWIEGYFFKIWDRTFILWGMTNDHPNMIEVIPETVSQFISLTDRYEKKIFEGDIVNIITGINGYKSTYHSTIQEVKYIADSGIAVFRPFDNSDIVEIEVIGNIYDNKELLENDKDKG